MPCSSQPVTNRTCRDAPPQTAAPILKGAMRCSQRPKASPPRRGALTIRDTSPADKAQASPGVLRATRPRHDGACVVPPQGASFPRKHSQKRGTDAGRDPGGMCSTLSAAAYFYPEDGERAGTSSSIWAQILERRRVCRAILSRIEMPGSRWCR